MDAQAAATSDRGSQFTSAVWAAICELLNILHVQTTTYHPEGNCMVERFHRRLKDALRARCASPDWIQHLPWVMLGIHATPRPPRQFSALLLFYLDKLQLILRLLWIILCQLLKQL